MKAGSLTPVHVLSAGDLHPTGRWQLPGSQVAYCVVSRPDGIVRARASLIPIYPITTADLRENGGRYVLSGKSDPFPVYLGAYGVTDIRDGLPIVVYPVDVNGNYDASFAGGSDPSPAPAPSVPTTNLITQFAADDLVGLSDGDPINPWAASAGSASAISLVQFSTEAVPVYKTGIQNGLPIARFDRTLPSILQSDSTYAESSAGIWTALLAVSPTHPTLGAYQYFLNNHVGTSTKAICGISTADELRLYLGTNLTAPSLAASFQVLTFVAAGAISLLRVNGVTVGGPGNAGGNNPIGTLDVGSPFNNLARGADMDLGELLIYDAALGGPALDDAESYLMTKWGVT